jgi:hypothetical protein
LNHTFDWYELVEGPDLEQGDFLSGCPLLLFPQGATCAGFLRAAKGEDPEEADILLADVVVMSQTCDLVQDKTQAVMLCSRHSLDEYAQREPRWASPKEKEHLRRGDFPAYHILNRCDLPDFSLDFQVVDFRDAHSLPVDVAREFAGSLGPRLRLLPPYREHLAQAFARYFMRVGLPIDIPPFV